MDVVIKQFATISVGSTKVLGVLEIVSGTARGVGDFYYWYFKTPDFLGNPNPVLTFTSCYGHIPEEFILHAELEAFGFTY